MKEKELRLLLVDDDELDRMAVVRALRKSELSGDIIEESDPTAVLARLNESDFDCILLDYDLGGITGLELLRQIRGAGFLTPVLLVTAQEDLVAMSAEGATDFLPKVDVSPIRLARRIRHVMRVAGADNRARLAIAQLESQRALQEAILRQMPSAVIVADGAGEKVMLANERVNELLGIQLEPNAPLARLAECIATDCQGHALAVQDWPIARVIRDGQPIVNEEITCVRKNGDKAILRVSASLVRDEFDRAAAVVMSLEDISVERAALAALERTKATRDEMLAIVSHDLKNPLNAIGVAIDELATDNVDAPTRDTYVGAIRRSIHRAHRLIQNLLDVSRIEAGRLKLERISMSPATLLEQARQESHVLAKEAGLELRVRATADLPPLIVDRDLMMQVMSNLIGNALRYGKSGKLIELTASGDDTYVIIAVADCGPGIPAASLPHIFDHYWQANRQRRGSAGLGLAIVRGIVEAHGGHVVARNREAGGAEFLVRMPVTPPTSEASATITLARPSAK